MINWVKKTLAIATTATVLLSAAACGSTRSGGGSSSAKKDVKDISVGISMPEQMLERWKKDGDNLKSALEKYGYKVVLQYADSKTDLQTSQIQNMANNGVDYVVIASIDGTATGRAAEQARQNGAKVIAYDRLIMNTDAVDYYATFNLEKVGQMQGQYIVDKLGVEKGKRGPFNVELMAGFPTDNNAGIYFKGAWSALGKYFKNGTFKSLSHKVPKSAEDWQSIGIDNWDRNKAQNEMENRVNSFYNNGEHLDAVLAQNDAEAMGTVNVVKAVGWNYYPVITGQDAEQANIQAISHGQQSMTVYKDTSKLAKATADMIHDMVQGKKPSTDTSYNNGNKDVPTVSLKPVAVDKSNLRSELVDSGYITAGKAGLSDSD